MLVFGDIISLNVRVVLYINIKDVFGIDLNGYLLGGLVIEYILYDVCIN